MDAKPIDFNRESDPSDAFVSRQMMRAEGRRDDNYLTFVELGVTSACNLKCAYCGEFENPIYASRHAATRDISDVIRALDELDTLRIISITGGEPLLSEPIIRNIVLPVLEFANAKGVYTQINSNLVVPEKHLELVAGKVSIIHTSINFFDAETFGDIVLPGQRNSTIQRLFEQLRGNFRMVADSMTALTAETLLYSSTLDRLGRINHLLAAWGADRQELQVPFPTKNPQFCLPTMDELLSHLAAFIKARNQDLLVQLDCAPVWPCIADARQQQLLSVLESAPNLLIRSCPDGRSRLNLNLDGEVRVTDFAETEPLGNIKSASLVEIFEAWKTSPLYRNYNCTCDARCLGPCILLADAYYPGWSSAANRQVMQDQLLKGAA